MSTFAALLKQHVTNKNISVLKISEEVGIDRTVFHTYMSEKRKPKSHIEVRRICKAMQLSAAEQTALLTAYFESQYGSKSYADFLTLQQILEGTQDFRLKPDVVTASAASLNALPEASSFLPQSSQVQTYNGALQVEYAFTSFLDRFVAEAAKAAAHTGTSVEAKNAGTDTMANDGTGTSAGADIGMSGFSGLKGVISSADTLHILMQPTQAQLMRLLMLHTAGQPVQLEQLLCLEQNPKDNNNLSLLLPAIALFLNHPGYHCRYYYDNVEAHINQMTLLPIMVLTKDSAFLCNQTCDSCCIIRNPEIAGFLLLQYTALSQVSEELGIPLQMFTEHNTRCEDYFQVGDPVYTFSYSPLFTLGMTMEMLMDHLTMDEEAKASFMQIVQHEFSVMGAGKGICEYFEKDALREFMESGEFPAYPSPEGFYRRPSMNIRLQILNKLIALNKEGYLSSHMSNHTYFRLSKENQVLSNPRQGYVEIRCETYGRSTSILLQEACLCSTLQEFPKYAMATNLFCSQDETVKYMESLAREFASGQ